MAARQFNNLIFFTIAGCCLSLIILGIVVGTPHWVDLTLRPLVTNATSYIEAKINYGLMSGKKTHTIYIGDTAQGSQTLDLKIVCRSKDNICMFSCGVSNDVRKSDLESLWLDPTSANDVVRCTRSSFGAFSELQEEVLADTFSSDKGMFLNFGLWLVTILFLVGAIIFSALAGVQALYNTFRAPSLPLFSVYGLYIWNGISACCTLLVLILWGAAFASLKNDPAISETISAQFKPTSSQLGYSYWILILAELLNIGNIGIIRYRSWKISQIGRKNQVVSEKFTSPENLLF